MPKCKLIGTDGNVYAIIGKVVKTLKKAGLNKEAETFKKTAFKCKSYDEVLVLLFDYVDVE